MCFFASRILVVTLLILISYPSDAAVGQTAVEANRFHRAAPEKCLAYIAWDASDEKPIEGNSTQALMSDPELRRFVDDLQTRAGLITPALVSGSSMPKLKTELLHWLSPRAAEAVFQRSGCLFVEAVDVPRGNPQASDVKAALMLDIGKDAARFVSKLAAFTKDKGEPSKNVELAGTKAYRVELQDLPFALYFGNSDSVVVLALGESAYSGAIERMQGEKTPQWLTDLQQKSQKLAHVHSLGYINGKDILRVVKKIAGPNASVVAELLGVANISKVEMIGGLNNKNSSIHVLIDTKEPEGLLGLVAKNPVNEKMFEEVPADALSAYAFTVDAKEVVALIDVAETLTGNLGFGQFKDAIQMQTQLDFEEDFLQKFGKNWLWYCGASDGWFGGTTIVGELEDAEKVAEAVDLFFEKTAEMTREFPGSDGPKLYKQVIGEHAIFSIQFQYFIFEPSVCVTGDRFYFAMFPQSLRTAVPGLSREETLFNSGQLAKFRDSRFLGDKAQLTGLAYHDTKTQLGVIYPLVQFYKANFAQFMFMYGSREPNMAALVDGFQLPPARSVLRHIEPSLAMIRTSDEGVEIEIRQTIPTNGIAMALPTVAGTLLPALGRLSSSAKETQSANNMRQIALASLNHESAYMRFPYDGPVQNKREHRFSWRVHILPFVEQNALYNEFRFDEPWDSEHNKALIEKMPEALQITKQQRQGRLDCLSRFR